MSAQDLPASAAVGSERVPLSQSSWGSPIALWDEYQPSSGCTLLLLRDWGALALGVVGRQWVSSKGWLALAVPLLALG